VNQEFRVAVLSVDSRVPSQLVPADWALARGINPADAYDFVEVAPGVKLACERIGNVGTPDGFGVGAQVIVAIEIPDQETPPAGKEGTDEPPDGVPAAAR
jgi:hypothetical protein